MAECSVPKSPKWKRPSDTLKLHKHRKRLSAVRQPCRSLSTGDVSLFLNDNNSNDKARSVKRRNPFSQFGQQPSKRWSTSDEQVVSSLNEDSVLLCDDVLSPEGETQSKLFNILNFAEKCVNLVSEESLDAFPLIKTENSFVAPPSEHSVLTFHNIQKSELEDDRLKLNNSSNVQSSASNDEPINHSFPGQQLKNERPSDSTPVSDRSKTDASSIHSCSYLPVDWSLKQKMRVISPSAFPWGDNMKSTEEANGVCDFVCNSGESICASATCNLATDISAALQKCTLLWQHPNLPWLKLFPRTTSDVRHTSKTGANLLSEETVHSLKVDWNESFRSVFHMFRSKHCPYLYLCSDHFTVLFRGVGISGEKDISAVITPTTRGLREALKAEGIEFSVPLIEVVNKDDIENHDPADPCNTDKNDITCTDSNVTRLDDDDLVKTNEGASIWLESMGLNKADFPSLDPNRVKIQREGFKTIDSRPESSIYIKGSEVQALFNFLLNWRSCIAPSGPLAGIPPTIFAPVAFKGATLQALRLRQTVAKQKTLEGNLDRVNILELSGPILPHNVQCLCALMTDHVHGGYAVAFNTHEPTSAFNTVQNELSQSIDESDSNDISTELTPEQVLPYSYRISSNVQVQRAFSSSKSIGKGALKDLEYQDDKFFWSL